MNEDKTIDFIGKALEVNEKTFKKIADEMTTTFAKQEAIYKDEGAKRFGVDRLTLFLRNKGCALLIKPNKMMNFWQINLFAAGSIDCPEEAELEFEAINITTECCRFFIKSEHFNYWVDLMDEEQLQNAAEFVGIEVKDN